MQNNHTNKRFTCDVVYWRFFWFSERPETLTISQFRFIFADIRVPSAIHLVYFWCDAHNLCASFIFRWVFLFMTCDSIFVPLESSVSFFLHYFSELFFSITVAMPDEYLIIDLKGNSALCCLETQCSSRRNRSKHVGRQKTKLSASRGASHYSFCYTIQLKNEKNYICRPPYDFIQYKNKKKTQMQFKKIEVSQTWKTSAENKEYTFLKLILPIIKRTRQL